MGGRRVHTALTVACAVALAACGGSEGSPAQRSDTPAPELRVADVDTAVLSGVSFDYPAEWVACRFPGSVVFGNLVEIGPAGSTPSSGTRLSVQVNEGAGTYRNMLELDRAALDTGSGEYSEEAFEVPGAEDGKLARYSGTAFGFEYAGATAYAVAPNGDVVKVSIYTAPELMEELEPVFQTAVNSLELGGDEKDTDLPECERPEAPTPPPSPDTAAVPAAIAGTYTMTLTDGQLERHPEVSWDDRRTWVIKLEGDVLKLGGATDPKRAVTIEAPILEATPDALVVQTTSCELPAEPVETTVTLSVEGDELTVQDVGPVCDDWLEEILTINVWKRM